MIEITKEESMALRAKYGNDIGITITNRHKKGGRKRYYTEETNRVLFFLERLRSGNKYPRKTQREKRGK
jgi:hypothetical protein